MARTWTPEQLLAINTTDRTLLVSAAAGSGKTATLTERIIRSILNDKNPADIGKMLIVTFTNAAVGELRERIGAAIKDAYAEHPDNKRLEHQLLTVKDAKIMTISSFCNDILKANSARVGLNPGYRIADEAEAALVCGSVMEPLINLAFEGELKDVCSAEEFAALADILTDAKSSSELAESFRLVYEKTECYADRMGELRRLADKYDPAGFSSVENSEYGRAIIEKTKEMLGAYRPLYRSLLDDISLGQDDAELGTVPFYSAEAEFIDKALGASSYAQLREYMNSAVFARRPGLKGERSDSYSKLCKIRDMLKKNVVDFAGDYFVYSDEEWRDLYINLYKYADILYKFIAKFDSEFTKEKKARGICEYGDLERYAYLCLYDNGKPNELAEEIKRSFEAVYIDEYQDVNDLENAIFAAVSREDNRFMVGDIKQSIYGFRLANPDIFASMKKAFKPLGKDGDRPGASLFMSNNFRSDKTVIDFANGVFDTMFGVLGESIGYVPDDRLKFSKVYPDGSSPTCVYPEIHVLEAAQSKSASEDSLGDAEEKELVSSAKRCASAIAAKIRELIDTSSKADGTPLRPSDFAIMMRSTQSSADIYKKALASVGIPSTVKESGDFFLNEEILLALSLLNSIDNPRKDIYLASLMCSPLFLFTPDELVRIRRSSDKETLYEALCDFTSEHPEYERGKSFLKTLKRYRVMSEGMSIDTLISILYRETGLLALAARTGGTDNLILLHSYARRFEASSFKGLYSFIDYVNSVIADDETIELSSNSGEGEDAVNIMTVHKSKGLEYPVCFLAGAESATRRTNSARIVYSQAYGIGIREKDESGLAIVENPIFNIIKSEIADREYEEELRVLYVALTRPREQLYIYGVPRGKLTSFMDKCELLRQIISPYFAKHFSTVLYMIAASYDKTTGKLIATPDDEQSFDCEDDGNEPLPNIEADKEAAPECSGGASSDELTEELYRRFTYKYERSHLLGIPSKLSVSRLYPEILDEADNDTAVLELSDESEKEAPKPVLPAFADTTAADESAKRGIATHLVLQFCDFERFEKLGARSEIERLKNEKYISEEDAARVRVRELEAFRLSPLFREIRGADKLWRELRFNVKIPAAILTDNSERREALIKDGEQVLVQGVIDCLFRSPDGSLKLIDYKTDRLTPEEKLDRSLAHKRLADKHRLQLSYYRLAIKDMFGKEPSKIGIYSLALGEEIEVEPRDL